MDGKGEWPERNVNCAEIWLSAGKKFQSDFIQIASSQVAIVLRLSDLSPFPDTQQDCICLALGGNSALQDESDLLACLLAHEATWRS